MMLDGIIIFICGFVEDLFVLDLENMFSVIWVGGGVFEKVIEFLDFNDWIQFIMFWCEVFVVDMIILEIVEIVYEII